jgi:predicted nucleic acid-binding protein
VILVDTSIWIEHFRRGLAPLVGLLGGGQVLSHPWVTGELSLGHLGQRLEVIGFLQQLPQAAVAEVYEVVAFVENERLFGSGIGYVDAQLLAATRLTPGSALWTFDKRLQAVAERLGIAHVPEAPHR